MNENDVTSERSVVTLQERKTAEYAARRAKILAVARDLFGKHDFDAVTMKMLVEKTGFNPPVIYALFANKEEIFLEICSEDFLSLRRAFNRITEIEDPLARLVESGRAYLTFALEHPHQYRLMFMNKKATELQPDPAKIERGNPDQDAYAFLRGIVAECFERGRLKHPSNDPDLIAQIMWSGVHGIIALHMTHANDPWVAWRPIEQLASAQMEALIRGLSPEER